MKFDDDRLLELKELYKSLTEYRPVVSFDKYGEVYNCLDIDDLLDLMILKWQGNLDT